MMLAGNVKMLRIAAMASLMSVVLMAGCSAPDGGADSSGSRFGQVEALREELKRGLEMQNVEATDSLATRLYLYGRQADDSSALLYGMIAKAQSFYMRSGRADSMSLYISKAETLARKVQDSWALATLYNIKGAYQAFAEMDCENAVGTLTEGISYASQCDDRSRLFPLESNLALTYYMRRDETGLPYALDVYRFGEENGHQFASYLGAVLSAYMYEMMGQHDKAEYYVEKALPQVAYYGDQRGVYALYGDVLSAKGEKASAVRYYRKALIEGKDSGRFSDIDAHIGYAGYLEQTGKVDSAIVLLHRALGISQYANRPSKTYLVYGELAALYERKGDWRTALACYKLYHAESDSLFSLKKERAVNEMEMKYERERYENGLRRHEMAELRWKHKFEFSLLCAVFVLLLLALGVIVYYRKNRQNIQMLKRFQEQLEDRQPKRGNSGSVQDEKMRDLFDRLQGSMQEQKLYRDPGLTRENVAARLQTNRTYLTEVIKRYTGLSFVHYVNSYRIEEAAAILSDPTDETPIKTIASSLGFTSLSTFYRLFQDIKGISPSQYRKRLSS